ncbi:MAG TPA: GAF domain-containing protein, partial [Dehalococcoidia bacterium]|nr:GAF domain-containing protein [Dehalococcoidia bacterium]
MTGARVGLDALDVFSAHVAIAANQDELVTVATSTLSRILGYTHCTLLLADESAQGLYVVGSHGYDSSGAGAEVSLGDGVIGAAAQRLQTIRLQHVSLEPVRAMESEEGHAAAIESTIAPPRLKAARSQIAVPLLDRTQHVGVVFLESDTTGRFSEADEAALNIAARQVSLAFALLRARAPTLPEVSAEMGTPGLVGRTTVIKHYAVDHSLFIGGDFLIKGVPGAILWRLLAAYIDEHRADLSARAIRLESNLELPDLGDHFESRLVLLSRRLADCCDFMRL